MKGGPRCKQCGKQLPNPANVNNKRKGNLTNCDGCGAPINFGGQWINPFDQSKSQPYNKNVIINPNMSRAAQAVMPTNIHVVNREDPSVFDRRKTKEQQELLLSDEDAEQTHTEHLDSVNSSAEALGL